MILLKNDEIIDFWTWPPTDFSALYLLRVPERVQYKIAVLV